MVRLEYGGIYENQSKLWIEDKNNTRNIIKKMMKIISLLSLITIILMSCIQNALFTSKDERKLNLKENEVTKRITFSHHAVLDKQGKFHLFWLPEEDIITFEIQVRKNLRIN